MTMFWKRSRALLVSCVAAASLSGCWLFGSDDDDKQPATPIQPAQVAPAITTQPVALSVVDGATNASFTVVATGTPAPTYQWQRNGANISGATSATYTVANATLADSGASYRVVVTNSVGSVTSAAAVLTVTAAPVAVVAPTITVNPQSANALDGGVATLTVTASGTAPFTYAWRRNGTAIADATGASYATPALTLADSGTVYSVVVSNSAGSVTSAGATITVNPVAAAVASQPAAVSVSAGQTATFSVTATGSSTLAYQWRRNGTSITGATAASYTTPVTTVADNGTRFSVVVSNAAGSATSADALLTVTAVAIAPAVATAPASVTVTEGQAASFSVAATGTAPLAYQWRRNGVDISGATAASYTVAATVLADNAARFSVRVTNPAGTATSADAVLTVQAAVSALAGRGWATGQSLEADDNVVSDVVSTIDDAGRATVIFRKANGTRTVLYATRGTPNAASVAPTWSAPVAIDLLAGNAVSNSNTEDLTLAVAPAGNVLAAWSTTAACGATTYRTSGTCTYYYTARYLPSAGSWEAPVLLGDIPGNGLDAHINDRGDIAVLAAGWVRSGTTNYTASKALYLRNGAEAAFRRSTFPVGAVTTTVADLDGAGNVLVAAQAPQNATVDLVAYRGTVAAGLGAAQVLDTRGSAASLQLAGVGVNGQQVIVWAQNNGVQDTNYAATSANATDAFSVVDLGYRLNTSTSFRRLTVSDAGQAIVYDLSARKRLRWTAASNWLPLENLPANLPNNNSFYGVASARSGDLLAVQLGGGGDWSSYDAARNVMVQAPISGSVSTGPGFVLGVASSPANYVDVNISQSGYGIVTMRNRFDVLPTAAAPAGDARTVTNLWGSFLK